ncbi:MAG: tetratricopeptide repeat protein [Planctomycetes bacterium]|nr:tetratricopeptide repeat protein [Planctomycetota bacterium]
MRRLFILTLLLTACACHHSGFEPVMPSDVGALEREVQDLIHQKANLVRASPANARAHATLGLVYEANEQWNEAARSFENAVAIDDSQPLWVFHRGIALFQAGEIELATGVLGEAARKLDRDPAVQQRLGHVLLEQGDVPGARAAFARALAAAPDSPECLAGMAGAELAVENWDEALKLARRALDIDRTYTYAAFAAGRAMQGLGRDDEARDLLAAGMGATRRWLGDALTQELRGYNLTVSGMMDAAGLAAATGNHARALALYEKILARTPEDLEALNNMAACLIDMGQLDRAEQVLGATLHRSPDSFATHLNCASLALKREDLQRARHHADRAVELGGSIGRSHYMRACVMILQDDWANAEKELHATLKLDARNTNCYLALSDAALRRDNLEEARGWCRKAIEIDPNLVPARMEQCSLALRAEDLVEAREALAVLERLAPGAARTRSLRGQLQERGR